MHVATEHAGSTVRNIVSTSITVHCPLRRLAQQLTLRDLWLLSIFTIGIKPLPCRQFLQTSFIRPNRNSTTQSALVVRPPAPQASVSGIERINAEEVMARAYSRTTPIYPAHPDMSRHAVHRNVSLQYQVRPSSKVQTTLLSRRRAGIRQRYIQAIFVARVGYSGDQIRGLEATPELAGIRRKPVVEVPGSSARPARWPLAEPKHARWQRQQPLIVCLLCC
jgi:hypothetical protein